MLRFALKNMGTKKIKILLVALSIVLSAGVALTAYNVSCQVSEGIVNTAGYYDMIIGPAGSATQLAMNTLFFTDTPLGAIDYDYVEALQNSSHVNQAVPFAMGDSFNAARIIGTTPAFLEGKDIAVGSMFSKKMECVVGFGVAQVYHLSVGDEIISSHGLGEMGATHEATPFTVTGILKKTGSAYDNGVFTSLESIWFMHEQEHDEEHEAGNLPKSTPKPLSEDVLKMRKSMHDSAPMSHSASKSEISEKETKVYNNETEVHDDAAHEGTVCAILVRTKSFEDYYALKDYYANNADLLIINPATVLREVLDNVDLSTKIVYLLCGIILLMNVFVIAVITVLNMYDSKQEIALMRLIGIGMNRITLLYMIENGLMGLMAAGLAMMLSHLTLTFMGSFVADMGIVLETWKIYPMEWAILLFVFLISVLPTVICTLRMAGKDGIS